MLRQWWVVGDRGIVEIIGLFVGGDQAFELFLPPGQPHSLPLDSLRRVIRGARHGEMGSEVLADEG